MDSQDGALDFMAAFYVGQHETKRALPVTDDVVHQAQDCGYDMLTTPITTPHFHGSVLTLLTTYNQANDAAGTPQPLPLIPPLKPLDTPLAPSDITSQLVTFTSPWIDLGSPDPLIAHLSRQVFNLEIAYASFCGVTNVVIQGPRASNVSDLSQYARAIKEALSIGSYVQFHLLLPAADSPDAEENEDMGHLAQFARPESTSSGKSKERSNIDIYTAWDRWNVVRSLCKYHPRLSVALNLGRRLPPISVQSRWYSEPLRLLYLPATSFLTNPRGSFVLSKPHQHFIYRCMRLRSAPWLLLSDVGKIPGIDNPDQIFDYPEMLSPEAAADAPSPGNSSSLSPTPAESAQIPNQSKRSRNDPTPHLSYIRYLQRNQPPKSIIERFGGGFQDYLQSPLQPLTDNLESITYEVFEKDPIKYDWYERAITQALRDWKAKGKSTSSSDGSVVVAVVGSGRGPLVTRALNASQNSGVPVQAYAIEKNPNAYVHLQRKNIDTWNGRVTVVKTDMRFWKGPVLPDGTNGRVDILVSELLGSFADNELSPECLDGVQHVLNPTDGISIPTSYTAHLTPIASPRLHADIIARATSTDPSSFDIPWVVMLQQFDYLSTVESVQQLNTNNKGKSEALPKPDVQLVWEFSHPCPTPILTQANLRRGGSIVGGGGGLTGGDGANEHNARYTKMSFRCKERGVCHGLAGYFETVLYSGSEGKVELSTNPVTMDEKSKDMISWFPIFFPLKNPLSIPENSELDISIWRQTDDRKVWYEWMVEAFVTVGGQRLRLGISDLHSSKSNGCLM